MTCKAYIIAGGYQELWEITLMGVMTGVAAAYSYRSVQEFAACQRAVVA
jgi:hypothetical protein